MPRDKAHAPWILLGLLLSGCTPSSEKGDLPEKGGPAITPGGGLEVAGATGDGATDDVEEAPTRHDHDAPPHPRVDLDGDGYGAVSVGGEDCEDEDAAISPEAVERCDGVDNDCDGETDEGDAEDALTWYADVDGDGRGDDRTTLAACAEPEGYSGVAGDCDDEDATTWPGAEERCDDGVVNDCDGDEVTAMAACGLVGSLSLGIADEELVGEDASDDAGYTVSGAGDVDGDGLHDVLVGAPIEDSGGSTAGAAYLLLGGGALATGPTPLRLADAEVKLTAEGNGDYAGYSVSSAGDADGDGRDDLLIGAYREDSGGSTAGAAYLLLSSGVLTTGSSPVSLAESDAKVTGEDEHDYAGCSVSGAGDVSGDGLDDLLVGAYFEDSSGSGAGAAYLVLGGGALTAGAHQLSLGDADAKLIGEDQNDYAGYAVSGAGDVDGDGLDDILVGAWRTSGGDTSSGAAYLVLGGGTLATGASQLYLVDTDAKLMGESEGVYAGYAVSGAGDVDGDGLDDILVGAPREDSDAPDSGAAYLLLGGGALAAGSSPMSLADAELKLAGQEANSYAGSSVSGAGDVDGDGLDDVLVGASDEDGAGRDAGAVHLLLGGGALRESASPFDLTEADAKFTGEAAEDNAGVSVSGAGDVDGDGFDDILIGAPEKDDGGTSAGAAYLIFGGGY